MTHVNDDLDDHLLFQVQFKDKQVYTFYQPIDQILGRYHENIALVLDTNLVTLNSMQLNKLLDRSAKPTPHLLPITN